MIENCRIGLFMPQELVDILLNQPEQNLADVKYPEFDNLRDLILEADDLVGHDSFTLWVTDFEHSIVSVFHIWLICYISQKLAPSYQTI